VPDPSERGKLQKRMAGTECSNFPGGASQPKKRVTLTEPREGRATEKAGDIVVMALVKDRVKGIRATINF